MATNSKGPPHGGLAASGYPRLAARIFDTPLLIEPQRLDVMLHAMAPRLGIEAPELQADQQQYLAAVSSGEADMMGDGYSVSDGVATIKVHGPLVMKGSWLSAMCGMTSYAWIEDALGQALADESVTEIIFDVDSPGGEVSGAFDLADRIYEARGQKPMTAVATEFAASAAYLIASACDDIVLPRTGAVGSIGVVMTHVSYAGHLQKRGVAVTHIFAGKRKVDGSPYTELSDRARADAQQQIDTLYGLFVSTVARNRGISPEAVRNTEAGMYLGSKAVEARLADRINTFSNEHSNAVLRRGARNPSRLNHDSQEIEMSDQKKPGESVTAEQLNAAVAAARTEEQAKTASAVAAAKKEGAAEGAARIKAILTDAEAGGRLDMAQHLAFESDMAAPAVIALLAKTPKTADAKNPLAELMAKHSPTVAATESEGVDPKQKSGLNSTDIFAKRRQAAGK